MPVKRVIKKAFPECKRQESLYFIVSLCVLVFMERRDVFASSLKMIDVSDDEPRKECDSVEP